MQTSANYSMAQGAVLSVLGLYKTAAPKINLGGPFGSGVVPQVTPQQRMAARLKELAAEGVPQVTPQQRMAARLKELNASLPKPGGASPQPVALQNAFGWISPHRYPREYGTPFSVLPRPKPGQGVVPTPENIHLHLRAERERHRSAKALFESDNPQGAGAQYLAGRESLLARHRGNTEALLRSFETGSPVAPAEAKPGYWGTRALEEQRARATSQEQSRTNWKRRLEREAAARRPPLPYGLQTAPRDLFADKFYQADRPRSYLRPPNAPAEVATPMQSGRVPTVDEVHDLGKQISLKYRGLRSDLDRKYPNRYVDGGKDHAAELMDLHYRARVERDALIQSLEQGRPITFEQLLERNKGILNSSGKFDGVVRHQLPRPPKGREDGI